MVVRGEHGLGHESAGTIVKLGPGVTTFKVGMFSPDPTFRHANIFRSRRPSRN